MTEAVPVEFKEKKGISHKIIPFCFGVGVFLFDQLIKFLVVKFIPMNSIKFSFFDGFLRVVHVRNLGAAFSVGHSLPDTLRSIVLAVIPVIVLVVVIVVYFRNNDFTFYQRWLICGIVGGGFGNVVDRIFRSAGVVDFIDFKFYGILGFNRFPTFNVADSFIMVCGILLFISFVQVIVKENKAQKGEDK